jgi:hypothetical protein
MTRISDIFGRTFGSGVDGDNGNSNNNNGSNKKDNPQEFIDELKNKYHFKTLKDTQEIWYYDDVRGTYLTNGEVIIKAALESEIGSELTNKEVSETLGHIQRSTYFDRSGFNPDLEWIGCCDCMLNLRTGDTHPFSPDFFEYHVHPGKIF